MNKKNKPKKFPLQPLGERVLLKELKEEKGKTKSGILLPSNAMDKETKKGEVVAVGPGKFEEGKTVPMTVKVGDKVIYTWGEKIEFEGVEYSIVRESDISAILN